MAKLQHYGKGRLSRSGVFIGGKVHPPTEDEKKMIDAHIAVIEQSITEHGYDFFFHALRDMRVWGGRRPDAKDVVIDGMTLHERIEKFPQKFIDKTKKLRHCPDPKMLTRKLVITRYLHESLRKSLAGIFFLSHESFGCGYEIGILRQAGIPVLAVSNIEEHLLPDVLLGDPSNVVETEHFKTKDELKKIVDVFLDKIKGRETLTMSFVVSRNLRDRIESRAKRNGKNASWVVKGILEKNLR